MMQQRNLTDKLFNNNDISVASLCHVALLRLLSGREPTLSEESDKSAASHDHTAFIIDSFSTTLHDGGNRERVTPPPKRELVV
jgi:hypothetical protein